MWRNSIVPFVVVLLLSATFADASIHRSEVARQRFARNEPCPATEEARLPCPGYVIDHIIPLCAGGADDPRNMQWEEYTESRLKDREEVHWCALAHRGKMPYFNGTNACQILTPDFPLLRRSSCE